MSKYYKVQRIDTLGEQQEEKVDISEVLKAGVDLDH
jgi:hypothetical protein